MLCCWGQTRSFLPLSGYALVTTSNFAHNSDGDPALPLYFSTDMVSTNSTSASKVQIKSRSIGLRGAMCFQQGHGHLGPWRTCGRRRSILSMALLSSTLQAGTNTDQMKVLCVITGGSVLLWTVHRVHIGVAVSTSGSPWGPYTDPRGTFALSFE